MEDIAIKEGSLEDILDLQNKIPEFEHKYEKDYFEQRYAGKEKVILIAEKDNNKIGFIVAYDRDNDGSFYCWVAGVLPEYRKAGAFSLLMKSMDTWAKKKGYDKIKVKTHNKFRQMLSYLVKNNFNFTLVEHSGNIQSYSIHLEKDL